MLKLLWTYDAGEAIESSAAIAGGTVYVGAQSKDLLAIDLATGKLLWKYRATAGIGESSPAIADSIGGAVFPEQLAGCEVDGQQILGLRPDVHRAAGNGGGRFDGFAGIVGPE